MRTINTVQQAIAAVEAGAVAIYRDTYKDQMRPLYRVLETQQEATEFRRLVQQVEEAEGALQVYGAIRRLEEFVGDRWCLPSYLRPIYDGRWLRDPQSLLEEEEMNRLWEEDQEWFAAQRDHFARETAEFVEVHCGTCGFRATVEKPLLGGVRTSHSEHCAGTLS